MTAYTDRCACTVPDEQHHHTPGNEPQPPQRPQTALYAVQHPDCGHVAAVARDRPTAAATHQLLASVGEHRWRVRHLPPGPAQDLAVTALLGDGPKGCDRCALDDPITQALLAAAILAGGTR